ncbi:MAG: hypothetical protein ABFS24_16100 [Pseudomonadota bacterium]
MYMRDKKMNIKLNIWQLGLTAAIAFTPVFSQASGPGTISAVSVFSPSPAAVEFPYQEALLRFEKIVEASTDIEVDIIWVNEIAPDTRQDIFNKLKDGVDVHLTHGLPRHFIHGDGRDAFKDIFENLPFGLNTEEFQTWVKVGGGQELYDEFYEPDGLLPFIGGNTGTQFGGWFAEEINDVSQFNGLEIRIAGFASYVLKLFGADAFSSAVGEVNPLLLGTNDPPGPSGRTGPIDAAELCCPIVDFNFGVAGTAIGQGFVWHYPGWHEPTANAQFVFNKSVFESYDAKTQEILRAAMAQAAQETDLNFNNRNREALEEIKQLEINGNSLQLHRFPDGVLEDLRDKTENDLYVNLCKATAVAGLHDGTKNFKKLCEDVLGGVLSFQDSMGEYGRLSEGAYYLTRESKDEICPAL